MVVLPKLNLVDKGRVQAPCMVVSYKGTQGSYQCTVFRSNNKLGEDGERWYTLPEVIDSNTGSLLTSYIKIIHQI